MKGNGKHLTKEEIEWAWSKWIEGYKLKDIAEVLGVCYRTVQRKMSVLQDRGRCKPFGWSKTRELPPLTRES